MLVARMGELWLLEECPHHPSTNYNSPHVRVMAQVLPQVVAQFRHQLVW